MSLKDKEKHDLTELHLCWSEDIKEAVLELKKYVNQYPCTYKDMDCRDDISDAIDEIFGDWDK